MANSELLVNLMGDRTRRRVLDLVWAAPHGLTVDEAAAAAGVHRTVASSHLRRLASAGLAVAAEERAGRGRPRLRYHAEAAAELAWPARRHRELAQVLATALSDLGAAGERAAATAARVFGARFGTLAALGGEYVRADERSLLSRPCPFLEACRSAGPVVCAVHAAILEGALGVGCHPLGPLPGGACAYRLARPLDGNI